VKASSGFGDDRGGERTGKRGVGSFLERRSRSGSKVTSSPPMR